MFQCLEFDTPPFAFSYHVSILFFFFGSLFFSSTSYRGFFLKMGVSFPSPAKNGPLVTVEQAQLVRCTCSL